MTGVVFSAYATGDDDAPCNLPAGSVTDKERRLKENEVMDNAIAEAQAFWRKRQYDSHAVTTFPVASDQTAELFTAEAQEKVEEFLNAAKKDIAASPAMLAILAEYREALRHLDRRHNAMYVQKCDVEVKAMHPDRLLEPDALWPSVKRAYLGRCTRDGCLSYSFKSKTDKERHMKIFHRPYRRVVEEDISGDEAEVTTKVIRVGGHKRGRPANTAIAGKWCCNECMQTFTSQGKLRRHAIDEGHNAEGRAKRAKAAG